MLLEYDSSTMAPLGLVVPKEDLIGKKIVVIDSGIEECIIDFENVGMEGADCDDGYNEREQAVLIYGNDGKIMVVQPNQDGSYWRKIVRNKIARMKEKRREQAAVRYAEDFLNFNGAQAKDMVVSSWGPYTSTVGNAIIS